MSDGKINRPNLSGAFSGGGEAPSRSAGLRGLLQSPERPADAPRPEAPAAVEAKPRTATRVPSGTAVANVAAYLEPDVLQAVKSARREGVEPGAAERTYDELLVQALSAVSEEDLASHFAPEPAASGAGLLAPRQARNRGKTGIQIQIRLDGAQRDSLEQLAAKVGAPSRSALANAAYRLHFLSKR